MKTLRHFCVAVVLSLVFTFSGLAGDIGCPGITGDISMPGATATGEMSAPGAVALDPGTEAVLSLVQGLLALF